MKNKLKALLSVFMLCMLSTSNIKANEINDNEIHSDGFIVNGITRAYIYLTQTKADYHSQVDVGVTLVVTENPRTAELEIYDVELDYISSRRSEDVYGAEAYKSEISSSGKSVDFWFSYKVKSSSGEESVRYTFARFSI